MILTASVLYYIILYGKRKPKGKGKMNADGIIFDVDGTLWDSSKGVADSWNEALAQNNIDVRITQADIQGIMGLTMDVIADKFFGKYPQKRRMEIMELCASHENDYLAEHGGEIYDKAKETFAYLRERCPLFIVSNCQQGYIECFLKHYKLGKYFTDHLCWGDNLFKKGDNIKLIIERNGLKNAVYVGDTQGDCDSAYYAGAKFIHAAYGFGSADRFDASIESLFELTKLF